MDDMIQKDIAFALMVNDKLVEAPGEYGRAITNNEAYRQFIVETQMLRSVTPEDWFTSPNRQGWAAVIRENRLAYEKATAAADTTAAADNAVVEELQRLRAEVEQLRASQQEAPTEDPPADPEPAPDPAPEPDPDATEEPEAA